MILNRFWNFVIESIETKALFEFHQSLLSTKSIDDEDEQHI